MNLNWLEKKCRLKSYRRIGSTLLSLLIGFWFAVSSCNFPGLYSPKDDVDIHELRETLDALSSQIQGPPTVLSSSEPQMTEMPATSISTEELPLPVLPVSTPEPNPDVYDYLSQPGDTVAALASRFNVDPLSIKSASDLPEEGLISPATSLTIPNRVGKTQYNLLALPDAEVINSPTSLDLDLSAFIDSSGGVLSTHSEMVQKQLLSGKEIVARVALESSVNPRLLLALLELRSGWVLGQTDAVYPNKYPIGFHIGAWEGLYKELVMTATHLNAGYYGWREGTLTEIQFANGKKVRVDPRLNAGTIAIQNLFAKLYGQEKWESAIYGPEGLLATYEMMFGDPWVRSEKSGILFPIGLVQPTLELPFGSGERWSLTGGPHPSWKTGSPRGAIDLAPVTGEKACTVSSRWVTAPAAGLIARSARNVVALDLDGDGNEQTGWVLIFMHIADHERISEGLFVEADTPIGHPSCEGGTSTGTHFHVARKFNGEWISAAGGLPMILGGWKVFAEAKNYQGGMNRGEQQVVASPVGPRTSIIVR